MSTFTCKCGATKHKAKGLCRLCYNNTPAQRAWKKAYMKTYMQNPKNKERVKTKAYHKTPQAIAYRTAYNQCPDVKKRVKAYCQSPARKAHVKAYNQRPEVKVLRRRTARKYDQTPKRKAYKNVQHQRPKWKAHRNSYMKKYMKSYCLRPEVKAHKRKYNEMWEKAPWKGTRRSETTKQKLREARAKQILPFKDTKIELAMQKELKARKIPFTPHKYLLGHQVDLFIAPDIIVEADGSYWHNLPNMKARDKRLNAMYQKAGYLVLRYWEHEINANVQGCVDEIENALIAHTLKCLIYAKL